MYVCIYVHKFMLVARVGGDWIRCGRIGQVTAAKAMKYSPHQRFSNRPNSRLHFLIDGLRHSLRAHAGGNESQWCGSDSR
jgi:hypothetical protein